MFTLVHDHPPPPPFATAPERVDRADAQHPEMEERNESGGLSALHDTVDPSHYRSFCFRGEGRCNFVISAKEADGEEVRWVEEYTKGFDKTYL